MDIGDGNLKIPQVSTVKSRANNGANDPKTQQQFGISIYTEKILNKFLN